jgi:hypothetical protein
MRDDHEKEAFNEQNPDGVLFESPPVWLLRKMANQENVVIFSIAGSKTTAEERSYNAKTL